MKHRFINMMCRRFGKADVKKIVKEPGYYDEIGHWVPGEETEVKVHPAALLPLNPDELTQDQGGTFTTNDRKLICYADISKGQEVIGNGDRYTNFGRRDYDDYAPELNIYILRREDESDD